MTDDNEQTLLRPVARSALPRAGTATVSSLRAYGLAIIAVAAAVGVGLLGQLLGLEQLETPVILMAIGATVWYAGAGPGAVAVLLSGFAVAYLFTPPLYELYIDPRDRVNFVVFMLFALMIGWFASRRRRADEALRHARDELEKVNAALEKRTAELEASNKELEAFAYSTSHDLRAPLRHVAAYSELLQKNASAALDERGRRYLANILESAKKMGALIDDLLAFSRIGRAETRMIVVSLGELARDVQREIERDTEGRDIAWRIGALPTVHGDRAMLKLALFNLVSNAAKFTRPRPRAEIEIGCSDGANGEVVVFLRDNGVGFDMKYVGKLFGVFQRLHLAETFEGTGIGLATVQRVVQRHGGRVWAEGVVDRGATFYFSLPRP